MKQKIRKHYHWLVAAVSLLYLVVFQLSDKERKKTASH